MSRPLRHWFANTRGNVASIFGLALPAIMIAIAGTVDYASLLSTRARMQSAADMAALAGAKELRLANANVAVVAIAARNQAVAALGAKGAGATVKAAIRDANTKVQVEIDEIAPSLFGALAPTGFTHIHVQAIAKTSASTPTCLLSLDQAGLIGVGVSAAIINSPGCGTYSNSKLPTGLTVLEGSISASQTCSAGGYIGISISVTPAALTDCPVLSDPLSARPAPTVGGCDHTAMVVAYGTETLFPGTYCGGLTVTLGATAVLTKGVYIIKDGPLLVNLGATLKGDGVGFYLTGALALLDFDFLSSINLKCPSDGPLAGILFFEDRAAQIGRIHLLSSRNAPDLLGTFYFPNGDLIVGAPTVVGGVQAICANLPITINQCPPLLADIAIDSAWTIIIAHDIIVNFGVRLTLNTNYSGTATAPPQEIPMGTASLAQ